MPRSFAALGLALLLLAPACSRRPAAEAQGQGRARGQAAQLPAPPPAVGSVEGLPRELQAAVAATPHFSALPKPQPGDWLAEHDEPGQSFEEFWRSKPNLPGPPRDTIYLQPIGGFEAGASPPLPVLERYTEAFFGLEVEVLAPVEIAALEVHTRAREGGQRQLLAGDVLAALKARLPDDAYCLVGLTMADLYPDEDWNYVFGYASLRQRVGVYSFARYDPAFFGEPRPEQVETLILRRSLKVMSHEIGHMFGMQHCVHFRCNMNGSNSLAESDGQPAHLCPVCLRKLQASTGVDPSDRYRALADLYTAEGLTREAAWAETRHSWLVDVPPE